MFFFSNRMKSNISIVDYNLIKTLFANQLCNQVIGISRKLTSLNTRFMIKCSTNMNIPVIIKYCIESSPYFCFFSCSFVQSTEKIIAFMAHNISNNCLITLLLCYYRHIHPTDNEFFHWHGKVIINQYYITSRTKICRNN